MHGLLQGLQIAGGYTRRPLWESLKVAMKNKDTWSGLAQRLHDHYVSSLAPVRPAQRRVPTAVVRTNRRLEGDFVTIPETGDPNAPAPVRRARKNPVCRRSHQPLTQQEAYRLERYRQMMASPARATSSRRHPSRTKVLSATIYCVRPSDLLPTNLLNDLDSD